MAGKITEQELDTTVSDKINNPTTIITFEIVGEADVTEYIFEHNKNTYDIISQVYNVNNQQINVYIDLPTLNSIRVIFNTIQVGETFTLKLSF